MKKFKRRRAPPSAGHESDVVPLSCPDCSGVLHLQREGPRHHLLYRCQVDHRYTLGSLIHAKEAQLERTLWSAVVLLKQMTYAYEDVFEELKKAPAAERTRVQRRIKEVRKQCSAIQRMIEGRHAVE